jgi:hypothetical protein
MGRSLLPKCGCENFRELSLKMQMPIVGSPFPMNEPPRVSTNPGHVRCRDLGPEPPKAAKSGNARSGMGDDRVHDSELFNSLEGAKKN